ncbi:helix-turn-helix domain-containing protein [Bacillus safensis]|nr:MULTISPECIES: helix-turn-helix transcriptional regulator [Bacillus]MCA0923114.1 helix-turn-helix domain-containing protein [Bacillus stratosphericus]USD81979.1 helix-turn-helix domain-containing protein [Bacillus safensis]WOI40434.1 helix-turn-helix transcriptional regulator [Bacillus altitudinis]
MRKLRLGVVLRKARLQAGISQEKLAEMLSRSRSCISKIENDQKVLDVPTYVRWMEATNAKEAMIATLCGIDPLAVTQQITAIMALFGG